jgi:TatD DNase family protein
MPLFDTHAHLADDQFDAVRDEIIQRASAAGVTSLLAVGTELASSQRCLALAKQHSFIRASAGIHPNHSAAAAPTEWEQIVALSDAPEVVALGESGLDRHWDDSPFDVQQDYFDRHIRLSQKTGLAFIVHMRDCEADVLAMLREAARRGPLKGVMHSFTGTADGAAECLSLGMHISFAGMVTFKKSDDLRQVARSIPNDRILIETDCPYLSPHPHRGQRPNEPALIVHTAHCLAETRGVTLEEFSRQTYDNALRLFSRA